MSKIIVNNREFLYSDSLLLKSLKQSITIYFYLCKETNQVLIVNELNQAYYYYDHVDEEGIQICFYTNINHLISDLKYNKNVVHIGFIDSGYF